MRAKGPGYKKPWAVGGENNLSRMSTEYGQVSPTRYPGRKRHSTQSPHPAGKKKKKEKAIQPMTPEDCDPVVREVVEDTRAAVEEMMKELNDMVDPTPPPPQFTLTTTYDNVEDFAKAKADSERKVNSLPLASSVDTLVCPCHDARLEARQSQKGWTYVNCPIQPCLLFCGQDQVPEYMKAVSSQPHPEVLDMWCCLQCFCREPTTLQQSHSPQNPDRLFLTCSKKQCHFFRWADQPLGPKYWSWFHDHPPKKADQLAEPPLPSRDAEGYPKRGYDIPGPPPRVRRKEDVEQERPLTDYEKQLLREIQDLKNRQEVMVASAPPKYSDSVENWQKGLETITHDRLGLF